MNGRTQLRIQRLMNYGAIGVGATVVGATVVGSTVVGTSVVGMAVVVTIWDEQPTGGSIKSSHVGSLGWKHNEPSARVYIPKQTGMVCQSLQYDPWYWGSLAHSVTLSHKPWHDGAAACVQIAIEEIRRMQRWMDRIVCQVYEFVMRDLSYVT